MKTNHILFIVIIISAALRFWNLDMVPPGPHTDEADTAYSAYSLLKTGLDPHGKFNFFSVSDDNIGGVRAPLYTYILIPLIQMFGLNTFTERLPSAILGVLSVWLVYFLSKKLFKSSSIALVIASLFSINPWAVGLSRQGLLEALCLFSILLGTIFFFYAKEKKLLYILSGLTFGLSMFTYDAPKIFLPFFLPLLFLYNRKTLLSSRKYVFLFLAIFLLFYSLVLKLTFFDKEIDRYNRSTIFGGVADVVNSERYLTKAPLWASSIFHSKPIDNIKRFETSYVSIFSINWFFINGGNNLQHSVGNHGQFYLFELPFFFIGIYTLYRKQLSLFLFLLGWMLIGAIPGGITNGNYVYRSVLVLPVPLIFSSFGIISFWNWCLKFSKSARAIIQYGFIMLMVPFIASYLFTYFFDYPVYASEWWNKQQNEAIEYISEHKNEYSFLFADGGEAWAISYAFANKIDPAVYQLAYKNQEVFKQRKIIKLHNIYFGLFPLDGVVTPSAYFPKKSLVVTNAVNFPTIKPIKVIYDPGNIRPIFKFFVIQ